jgi:hypothetical protein
MASVGRPEATAELRSYAAARPDLRAEVIRRHARPSLDRSRVRPPLAHTLAAANPSLACCGGALGDQVVDLTVAEIELGGQDLAGMFAQQGRPGQWHVAGR